MTPEEREILRELEAEYQALHEVLEAKRLAEWAARGEYWKAFGPAQVARETLIRFRSSVKE